MLFSERIFKRIYFVWIYRSYYDDYSAMMDGWLIVYLSISK